ncbi:FUSC family protein [Psychrobacter sp.]|uniref:FUSC family protein n=1 Tax=Psychrobacter sp. TaxID=56811 RepID=UPI0025DD633A|nr:FUSC family protein [Psychrobacter sp.]
MENKSLKQRLAAPFIEPYARYQNADLLHAMRIGLAIVTALIINQVTEIPHGEWTTITVFIILGLLQYQGAIYTKAIERIAGTALGIVIGLVLLFLNHNLLNEQWLYYLVIGVVSAIIGYYAIRQLGYIGMLTGITMCMIISSTSNVGEDGLYRALNVIIGTLISVVATVILPLKSTLMWRFLLANNLEACAQVYDGVGLHVQEPNDNQQLHPLSIEALAPTIKAASIQRVDLDDQLLSPRESRVDLGATTITSIGELSDTKIGSLVNDDMVQRLKKINQRLLKARAHIAATANETGIDKQTLDQIQRMHRNIIGTIDLLLSAAPTLNQHPIDGDNRILLEHYHSELTQAMRHMAAVLRSPSDEVFRPITRIKISDYPSIHQLDFEWQGYFWLTQTLQAQLQSLSDLLQQTQVQWYKGSGVRYQRQEQRRINAQGRESDLDL